MTVNDPKREIVVVTKERIFYGALTTRGRAEKTSTTSLIDLLSNPVKTQSDEKRATVHHSDLLYMSDVRIYTIKNDTYDQRSEVYIPVHSIFFSFESDREGYRVDPDFKLQAGMEQYQSQPLEIGMGEYLFKGWNTNFFGRYHKSNIGFIAIINATIKFTTQFRSELINKNFYALNKSKIDHVVVLDK